MIDTSQQMDYRLSNLNNKHDRIAYQMSTGKKIDQGSENSRVYAREIHIKDRIRVYEGLKSQIDKTNAENEVSDTAVGNIKTLMDSIKTSVLKSLNSGMTEEDKIAVASNVQGMRDNILTMANTKVNGEYVFTGSDTTIKPFTEDKDGKVTYNGNGVLKEIAVAPNDYRDRGVSGVDIMMYSTSEAVKAQTLNFKGDERIYDQEGLEWKMNAGKTQVEQYNREGKLTGNSLAIASTTGTPPVYTTAPVNTAGGYSNEFSLKAKHNFFDDMNAIIKALKNNDNDTLRKSLDKIDKAYSQTNVAHAQLGGRNKSFEEAGERMEAKLTHYTILNQEVSGANLSKVAMESKALEMTYSALYSTISKMSTLSLVNFIR